MGEFIQLVVSGVAAGAIYALAALGFTLLWQASGTINFAQGEFVMLPAFAILFFAAQGLPLWAACLLACVVAAVLLGVAFKHVNVFVSPDMYIFAPGGKAYVEAANSTLKDQIVYGSAYPLRPLVQTISDNRKLGFEADSLEQYFSGNAKRIFKL